jgi:uncharacterized membrane protein
MLNVANGQHRFRPVRERGILVAMNLLLLCFLIGVICGLRSMMAPAAVCWGAHLGWLHFAGTKLSFIDNPITLAVFTLFALGELVADKLPKTPARTAPPGLIARIVFGAACAGALAVSAAGNVGAACGMGVAGAIVGTFGGYRVRRALTTSGKLPDLPVALIEDVIAIVGGFLIVSHV